MAETWMIVNPSTTQVMAFVEQKDTTTLTVSSSTVEDEHTIRLPMLWMVSDREASGFPWPFRKDGRMNHWYRLAVDKIEGQPQTLRNEFWTFIDGSCE